MLGRDALVDPDQLQSHLPAGQRIGSDIRVHDRVGSTNDILRELAISGEASHGTVVYASEQTAGRGRRDARWHAPRNSSLLHSILLEPGWPAELMGRIPLVAGLAVARAVLSETGVAVSVKWPNDLWAGGRKLGGILAESDGLPGERVVLGIGLNLYHRKPDFPAGLSETATSVFLERGSDFPPEPVAARILVELEQLLGQAATGFGQIVAELEQILVWKGQPVACLEGQEAVAGIIEGIGSEGELVLREKDGTNRRLYHAIDLRPG